VYMQVQRGAGRTVRKELADEDKMKDVFGAPRKITRV
jgi:hypothetical protein